MRTATALRAAVQGCRGCPLYADATQAVFGRGLLSAQIMLVGEQPGDQEDREGVPFVGPAGRVLDRALDAAGVDRRTTYVTNAVKHFKWKARGPRRIHQKPAWSEQMACRPWLEEEIALVEPRAIVLLGATAAQTMLGKSFRVSRRRDAVHIGHLHVEQDEREILLLQELERFRSRLRSDDRERMFDDLVADLHLVVRTLDDS